MNKQRINLNDSTYDVLSKMADGNPGALGTLVDIFKEGEKIDPDAAFGGLGAIMLLDTWGIYGSDIYILNNDICQRSIPKTLAVLRATQLGMFSSVTLKDACHRPDRSGTKLVPVDELYSKVKEKLPNFDTQSEVI